MKAGRQTGFTLIELLVAVAIVGILAAIAIPSYQEHVRKGHRAAAQSEMMDIANREQQFLLSNRVYADTATIVGSGYVLPSGVANNYQWNVAPAGGAGVAPSFTITFTPTGSQLPDGVLVLTSDGQKSRAGDPAKW